MFMVDLWLALRLSSLHSYARVFSIFDRRLPLAIIEEPCQHLNYERPRTQQASRVGIAWSKSSIHGSFQEVRVSRGL